MNYIKHLTGFFNRIALEKSLNPTHISLYLALFQCWNVSRFKNPITISRDEMMKGSKIASKATYHKCIKELQRLNFLEYHPSYNPYSGTQVFMINFSEASKPNIEQITSSKNGITLPKNEHADSNDSEQVDEPPYIYNNKKTNKNNENIDIEPEFQFLNDNSVFKNSLKKEKEMPFAFADTEKKQTEDGRQKSSAKKEKMIIPTLGLIKEYFLFQECTEYEAERYFNYYSSNGWLIGGKTKMKDWKASARNWMLNTSKFAINIPTVKSQNEQHNPRAYNLNVTTNKNYAEPL